MTFTKKTLNMILFAFVFSLYGWSVAHASTLAFNFSFGDGNGTVSGTIFGLEDNARSSPVSASIIVEGRRENFTKSDLNGGGFRVENGEIVSGYFSSAWGAGFDEWRSGKSYSLTFGTSGYGTSELMVGAFAIYPDGSTDGFYSHSIFGKDEDGNFTDGVKFTPVPLPAGSLLLITAMLAAAALKRHNSHTS